MAELGVVYEILGNISNGLTKPAGNVYHRVLTLTSTDLEPFYASSGEDTWNINSTLFCNWKCMIYDQDQSTRSTRFIQSIMATKTAGATSCSHFVCPSSNTIKLIFYWNPW